MDTENIRSQWHVYPPCVGFIVVLCLCLLWFVGLHSAPGGAAAQTLTANLVDLHSAPSDPYATLCAEMIQSPHPPQSSVQPAAPGPVAWPRRVPCAPARAAGSAPLVSLLPAP